MGDLISRQTAIKFVSGIIWQEGETWRDVQDRIVDGVSRLPSADRPTGKWIVKQGSHEYMRISWYACDQCGGVGDISDKFCKHCGAKMEL